PTFVMTAVFLVLVVALIVWANTRPVTPRHFVRLHTTMILSWAVCYTLGLLIGRLYFMENPTWWILAAAATALPGLIVALVSLRQSRSACEPSAQPAGRGDPLPRPLLQRCGTVRIGPGGVSVHTRYGVDQ